MDTTAIVKRAREGGDDGSGKRLRVDTQAALAVVVAQGIERTSQLVAPTMLLTGHQAAVYSLAFDPTGKYLASCSFDKTIMLWEVYGEGNCNYNVLQGHRNAVLQVSGETVRKSEKSLHLTERTVARECLCPLLHARQQGC